eukprot:gb/GECH01013059.1/.p1 GENE.gb/GECH01013059.1/~~gb/GECH01013059.1/.p1  ORF type:complete len:561 (+),score=129.31 gb/GECH01013059.1/:1-1683(+)
MPKKNKRKKEKKSSKALNGTKTSHSHNDNEYKKQEEEESSQSQNHFNIIEDPLPNNKNEDVNEQDEHSEEVNRSDSSENDVSSLNKPNTNQVVAPFEWMDEPKNFLYKDVEASVSTADLLDRVESEVLKNYKALKSQPSSYDLGSILPYFTEAVEAVAKDDFTEAFIPQPPEPWNWNFLLWVMWASGVMFRYTVLLPLRLCILTSGCTAFATCAIASILFISNETRRTKLLRKLLRWFASLWIFSLTGVIKYHGNIPERRKNQIYVSNHTSLLDFVILHEAAGVATLGQKHGGIVGFIQDTVIAPLKNIWFERFEQRDRRLVADRILQHIRDLNNPPLLVFPEGVCVNNKYCVMFKKGAFELDDDVEVCPIAMKYNGSFSDAYWFSKKESFASYIIRLMKSWCVVCDVHFLEPTKKRKDESAIEFSNRIKNMIAERAGLVNVSWDGYLKYYQPSRRFKEERQHSFAELLKKKLHNEGSESYVVQESEPSELERRNSAPIIKHRNFNKMNHYNNNSNNKNNNDQVVENSEEESELESFIHHEESQNKNQRNSNKHMNKKTK